MSSRLRVRVPATAGSQDPGAQLPSDVENIKHNNPAAPTITVRVTDFKAAASATAVAE